MHKYVFINTLLLHTRQHYYLAQFTGSFNQIRCLFIVALESSHIVIGPEKFLIMFVTQISFIKDNKSYRKVKLAYRIGNIQPSFNILTFFFADHSMFSRAAGCTPVPHHGNHEEEASKPVEDHLPTQGCPSEQTADRHCNDGPKLDP